jgi:Tol biopolymer transport system component
LSRRFSKRLLVFAIAAAIAGGCGGHSGSHAINPPARESTPTGEILFALTTPSGGSDLYLMRGDGSHRRRLTNQGSVRSFVEGANWAPDGQRIAYGRSVLHSRGRVTHDIYVIDVPGVAPRRITTSGTDANPAWSPDGKRIAFSRIDMHRQELPIKAELWTMRPDGTDQRRLTTGGSDGGAAWSPDGSRIAFNRSTFDKKTYTFHQSLYVVPAEGGATRMLSEHSGSPDWSPDGSRLAVVDERDNNGNNCYDECTIDGELYVMHADGSDAARLTRTKAPEGTPSWSPDGERIVFSSSLAGGQYADELYSISPSGGCPIRLTNGTSALTQPRWRPGRGEIATPHAGRCLRGYRSTGRRVAFDTDLSQARRFHRHALYWLGRSFEGLSLSAALGDRYGFSFEYDDCGRSPGTCEPGFEVQVSSICRDYPLAFPPPDASQTVISRKRGGLLVVGVGGGPLLYTGSAAVKPIVSRERRDRVLSALRRFGRGRREHSFPPPRFPAAMLRELRRTERAYDELHSLRRVRDRLGVSKSEVRFRLRLSTVLRAFGRLGTTHCPRVKRVPHN